MREQVNAPAAAGCRIQLLNEWAVRFFLRKYLRRSATSSSDRRVPSTARLHSIPEPVVRAAISFGGATKFLCQGGAEVRRELRECSDPHEPQIYLFGRVRDATPDVRFAAPS